MKSSLMLLTVSLTICSIDSIAQYASSKNADPEKFALVEGHKMHYQSKGAGAITVIFESGHWSDLHDWDKVFDDVAKFAKVFRYDRMGYGLSDLAETPRSFDQMARELHALLQKARISPPYVLVGHSLGGTLIRAYTSLYKTEVKGLVFVDPFNEFVMNGWSAEQKKRTAEALDSSLLDAPPAAIAEAKFFGSEWLNDFPHIRSFGALPDVPMILLGAGKDRPPTWEKSITEFYENKMHHLSESRLILIPNSPHYIQNFEPSLIIESVRRVVFPDALTVLEKILHQNGVDSCVAEYLKMKRTYPHEYMLESHLNTLGYDLLRNGDAQGAIKLFSLNVKIYASSFNVYDSLGEAYMDAGNKQLAKKNYERSLALNPGNRNAVARLKTLR